MSVEGWEFEMVSAAETEAGIKGIDPAIAKVPVEQGGLNWSFVTNHYPLSERLPFMWQTGLLKRLRTDDYDAVIFLGNVYFLSTWVGLRVSRNLGKKVLFWTHGFLGKDRPFLRWLRNLFYRQSDACLLYGNRAKELMLQSGGYDRTLLQVIYNSIDYRDMEQAISTLSSSSRRELRARLFAAFECPVVVAVGRVNTAKRFDLLIEAVRILKERGVGVNCLIIGDGSELDALKQQAQSNGLGGQIHFTGELYGAAADEMLVCCDVCVIPGNVGLSAMHAMSAGLPVISHDRLDLQMPEHEAIVEGKTGAFYKYGSVESLADVIAQWVLNHQDFTAVRLACRERIRAHFHVDRQVELIVGLLNHLVKGQDDA